MTPTVPTMYFPRFGALKAEVNNQASELHQCPGNGTHTRLVDLRGVKYKINYQTHQVTKEKASTCWEGFTSALRKFFSSCRTETNGDYLTRKLFGDGGGGCNHRHDDSLSVAGAAPPPDNPFAADASSTAGQSEPQPEQQPAQPQPAQSPMLGTGPAAPLTKAQSCPDLGGIPAPPAYSAPSPPLRPRAVSCPPEVGSFDIPPPPSHPAPPAPPKPRVRMAKGASGGAGEDHRPPSPPPDYYPMPPSLSRLFLREEHRPNTMPSSEGGPARFKYDGVGMSTAQQARLRPLVDSTKPDLGVTPELIERHPQLLRLPIKTQLGGHHSELVLHRLCQSGSLDVVARALGTAGIESLLGLCDFDFKSPLSRLADRPGFLELVMEAGIDPKWLSRTDAGGCSPFHRSLMQGCYENCMYVLTHWPEACNVRTRKGQYCAQLLAQSGFTHAQQQSLRGLMGSGAFPPHERPLRPSSPVSSV